jgi:crotonyl-CoA carboxylase/reductase
MTVGVQTCSPSTAVLDVARFMLEHDLEAMVVLDDGHAVGVVSRQELVKAYARQDFAELTAGQIMREEVPQAPPDIPLAAAAQIMLDMGVRALFMMHHAAGVEYPAGVLTFRHLIRHLAAEEPDELTDLGIEADRESPIETFLKRRDAARKKRGL